MIAAVTYKVPVEVLVDMDTGAVVRVTVQDEHVARDEAVAVFTDDYRHEVTTETAESAIGFAEAGEWPAWKVGP